MTAIVWIRKDLRLHDNPGLYHTAETGKVLPVYIFDEDDKIGSAQKWFLHHALESFQKRLKSAGSELLILSGKPSEILPDIVEKYEADSIHWNRQYEPAVFNRDREIGESLHKNGISVNTYEGRLLLPPWDVKKNNGDPYKVFTPFYKALQKHDIPQALPAVKNIEPASFNKRDSLSLDDLKLLPEINWTSGMEKRWTPSEEAAVRRFNAFLDKKLKVYKSKRDFPSEEASSALSPYFALGLLSVRSVYHSIKKSAEAAGEPFIRQLVWRDFAYSLITHFPETKTDPMNEQFKSFKWMDESDQLKAWKHGKTGFPIVDAGMRELWTTGYMHNRVRMITGSFLTKDLLIHWREGADWFDDTLVDADVANNVMGWQWVAGSGADASPFFRIFNPTTQSSKFDPNGEYIRQWIPELKHMPTKHIHDPSSAPDDVLEEAGVQIGRDYPEPIVDHKAARQRALDHYDDVKKG
ncbi:deoxyribodipyrimidine photo-lyase [Jeotgalibacillus alimentarius]|uniref:Deoxyribodipyrimidine photo-lyase n=1 Tax=Jeotgalibacillus alimentarius TaxID=135826 RepID=A0A0C2W1W6_9BACL|nr:deoxyribodipyrimidine photo-lyase [Jeotgalibacillus alimentarius]KIL50103.1 deoxyribodipyrimidine photo-lyase [Jeotgalibacillus alimentarius]